MRQMAFMILLIFGFLSIEAQSLQTENLSKWPVAFDTNWLVARVPYAAQVYRYFKPYTNGKPGGYIRGYYTSGVLQSEGTTSTNMNPSILDDFVKEGVFTWYHRNGRIATISTFRDNKLEGHRTAFSDKGIVLEDGNFVAGNPNGVYKQFYQSGKLHFESVYDNGNLVNNLITEYDENGGKTFQYNELFTRYDKNYGWNLGNFDTHTSVVELNKGLTISNLKSNHVNYSIPNPSLTSPYAFSCKISSVSGSEDVYFGVTFDFTDWNNYKYFTISDKGYFVVGQYLGNVNSFFSAPAANEAVKKAQQYGGMVYNNVNILEIENKDGKTLFKINDKLVFTAGLIYSGNARNGLYVEGGKKAVTFNQFIIKTK